MTDRELLEENNKMLKEILSFVRKVDSVEYRDHQDFMEVAMNFIKEAYPFNEETESFIRKKFDMPIPDESKEQ